MCVCVCVCVCVCNIIRKQFAESDVNIHHGTLWIIIDWPGDLW